MVPAVGMLGPPWGGFLEFPRRTTSQPSSCWFLCGDRSVAGGFEPLGLPSGCSPTVALPVSVPGLVLLGPAVDIGVPADLPTGASVVADRFEPEGFPPGCSPTAGWCGWYRNPVLLGPAIVSLEVSLLLTGTLGLCLVCWDLFNSILMCYLTSSPWFPTLHGARTGDANIWHQDYQRGIGQESLCSLRDIRNSEGTAVRYDPHTDSCSDTPLSLQHGRTQPCRFARPPLTSPAIL